MNAGPTSERIYEALKARILSRAYRPGDRLDPALIGEALNSSVTPVRDALNILSGEGLVETRTSEGFHIPPLDAPALEDLYTWNAQVLHLTIKCWRKPPFHPLPALPADPASRTAALFAVLATRSDNAEHGQCVASLNARLHAIRIAEIEIVADGEREIATLLAGIEAADRPRLRSLIHSYHRRRRRAAAAIVRILYRGGGF